MKSIRWVVAAALVSLAACGGESSTPSAETSQLLGQQTLPETSGASSNSQRPSDTQPALIDASTDIDAIDLPVVLWFWSPG